jgi:hypothetical protein
LIYFVRPNLFTGDEPTTSSPPARPILLQSVHCPSHCKQTLRSFTSVHTRLDTPHLPRAASPHRPSNAGVAKPLQHIPQISLSKPFPSPSASPPNRTLSRSLQPSRQRTIRLSYDIIIPTRPIHFHRTPTPVNLFRPKFA